MLDAKTAEAIRTVLTPRSIAVVGASDDTAYGGRFVRNLVTGGYRGTIYPVNPKYREVQGLPCFPSLHQIPGPIDVAAIIVPVGASMEVMQACAARGVRAAIMITAGFAERGEEGQRRQAELGEFARAHDVRLLGPNCLGVANVPEGILANAMANPTRAPLVPGDIALLSQSGALGLGVLFPRAQERGIGLNCVVTTGNEADLGITDFLEYFLDDPGTRVMACFIEGLRDGRRFLEVARRASERGKPVVVLKLGRTAQGARSAISHTGSLTGDDAVCEAAFRQAGATRVLDLDELFETASLFARAPLPAGDGVGAMSSSGGLSGLIADLAGHLGVRLPELGRETRRGLEEILGPFGAVGNPADITGHLARDTFAKILALFLNDPALDLVVVGAGMGAIGERSAHIATTMLAAVETSRKPIVALWPGAGIGVPTEEPQGYRMLEASRRVPVFYQPATCLRAVKAFQEYRRWRARTLGQGDRSAEEVWGRPKRAGLAEARRRLAAASGPLTEVEALALLGACGLATVEGRGATSPDEAVGAAEAVGYPVAVKVSAGGLAHKTEAGGVRLNLGTAEEVRRAYDEVLGAAKARAPEASIRGVLVQRMVRDGIEAIVGVSRDPTFGPTVMVGLGGVLTEAIRDVAHGIAPITRAEAEAMIGRLRGSRLLVGFRGGPPRDSPALARAIVMLSHLALELEDVLAEIDLNPLMVLEAGQGAVAVDAVIVPVREGERSGIRE